MRLLQEGSQAVRSAGRGFCSATGRPWSSSRRPAYARNAPSDWLSSNIPHRSRRHPDKKSPPCPDRISRCSQSGYISRSEEHTSELQSRQYLVCRLLLEKKKKPIV